MSRGRGSPWVVILPGRLANGPWNEHFLHPRAGHCYSEVKKWTNIKIWIVAASSIFSCLIIRFARVYSDGCYGSTTIDLSLHTAIRSPVRGTRPLYRTLGSLSPKRDNLDAVSRVFQIEGSVPPCCTLWDSVQPAWMSRGCGAPPPDATRKDPGPTPGSVMGSTRLGLRYLTAETSSRIDCGFFWGRRPVF